MSQLRVYSFVMMASLLLVIGSVLILPVSAFARASVPPRSVVADISVPAGYELLFRSHARGVQIYECQNGQWAFHAPRAALFGEDGHKRIGNHYGGIDQNLTPGPWWESKDDGSRIRAGEAISEPSPNANSIPLLRLKVLEWYGSGTFSQVKYIQRLNTVGGVGPAGACNAGQQRHVPYTADYYFYGNP
jgi:hypothetical protein